MKLSYGMGLILTGILSGAVLADQAAPASAPATMAVSSKGEFYVNPGIALTGAGASNYKNSFSLDAAYLKAVHQIASIGWEAGYLFGSKFEGNAPGSSTDTSVKILHVTPEIKLGPTFDVLGYQVNPFIIGGGGLYWSHQNSGTQTSASGATSAVSSFDHVNGGWNIGAGAAVSLPGNWSIGMDFRRQDIVNKHTDDFTWFTPALRFALLFS